MKVDIAIFAMFSAPDLNCSLFHSITASVYAKMKQKPSEFFFICVLIG